MQQKQKDHTKPLDTRRVVFDVRLIASPLTYVNCSGERADKLLREYGAQNVVIKARVTR